MRHDIIADALTALTNAEKTGKSTCVVKPVSNTLKGVLKIMKDHGYIEEYEHVEDKKGGIIRVKMKRKINKAQAIKPRFPFKATDIEKFEKRYLPAKGFGLLILSTPKGLTTNINAKKQRMGGSLIAYVY